LLEEEFKVGPTIFGKRVQEGWLAGLHEAEYRVYMMGAFESAAARTKLRKSEVRLSPSQFLRVRATKLSLSQNCKKRKPFCPARRDRN